MNKTLIHKTRLNHSGALQIPLLLFLIVFVFAGFRIWGFLRHWKHLVETQLRLDQCVGTTAQEFRDQLNSLIQLNQRVWQLRIAIQAAQIKPWLVPPLKMILILVTTRQEMIQFQWQLRQGKWMLSQGCGSRGDWALPLPSFDFKRDPPDSTGPMPLSWKGQMPKEFYFYVMHSPRHAAARVEGGSDGTLGQTKKWIAVWAPPKQFSWANLP